MIILFLSLLILIVGIIIVTICSKKDITSDIRFVGDVLVILGVVISFTLGTVIIAVQTTKDIGYESALYEKEVIEYRIENIYNNVVGNELLYNDIVKYNNNLRKAKMLSNNLWINWFVNDKLAEIDYIEYKE